MRYIRWSIAAVVILSLIVGYQFGYLVGPDPFVSATYNQQWSSSTSNAYIQTLKANSKVWGLGQQLIAYHSLDRDYPWYVDQGTTGIHSNDNCGPSVVSMAIKWYHQKSELSADWARLYKRPWGGWWYAKDIMAILEKFEVPYDQISVSKISHLVTLLQNGRLLITCNTMGQIPRGDVDSRINRFYDFDSGHFLVIKGYVQVDETLYFQVLDPNNWSSFNNDGTPKGRDRYYEAKALLNAIQVWYPYVIAIDAKVN